jgi:hypothetical protein
LLRTIEGGGVLSAARTQRAPLGPIALAITVIAFAITAATAYGASTRAEYVAQVDPICQTAQRPVFRAISEWLRVVEKAGRADNPPSGFNVPDELIRPAVKFINRLTHVYAGITTKIAAIPPAPGDEGLVGSWLERRRVVVRELRTATHALKDRDRKRYIRAARAERRALANANRIGRTLGVQVECASRGRALFEFDPYD